MDIERSADRPDPRSIDPQDQEVITMTTRLLQVAQADDRRHRAQQAAARSRIRRIGRAARAATRPADHHEADHHGPTRSVAPAPRLVNGAAASSAFATGRG